MRVTLGLIALTAAIAVAALPAMSASQNESSGPDKTLGQKHKLSPAQAEAAAQEDQFFESEWVRYLALPADQEAAVNRALSVKHRYMDELTAIPGVGQVWVDAGKNQAPTMHVDVRDGTPEIARQVPSIIEGVPVQIVKADRWFLIEPPPPPPPGTLGAR